MEYIYIDVMYGYAHSNPWLEYIYIHVDFIYQGYRYYISIWWLLYLYIVGVCIRYKLNISGKRDI